MRAHSTNPGARHQAAPPPIPENPGGAMFAAQTPTEFHAIAQCTVVGVGAYPTVGSTIGSIALREESPHPQRFGRAPGLRVTTALHMWRVSVHNLRDLPNAARLHQ